MKTQQALQAAREALLPISHNSTDDPRGCADKALALIDEALAEKVEPTVKESLHVATGWAAPKDRYAVPVLFNPYTGEPRDVRDVQSDPQGILIVPPGKVLQLAAHPAPALAEKVEPVETQATGTPYVQNERNNLVRYAAHPAPAPVNAKLLEALKNLRNEISCHNDNPYCGLDTVDTDEADAAIAQAEKGQV